MTEIAGIQLEDRNEDGTLIVSSTYGSTDDPIWTSRKHIALAGQTSFFDIEVTVELRLKTGAYRIINYNDIHEDDYIEFSIIDKNDVLGLFSTYGLTPGVDVLEIHKFLKNEYPEQSACYGVETWGASLLIPGLFFRIAYNSYGIIDINFVSRILWFV